MAFVVPVLPSASPMRRPSWSLPQSHSAAEWEKHRFRIMQLYRLRDWTLQRVMRQMEVEHGFVASVKQYKNKITEWGLDKNNKRSEALAILGEKRKREANGESCLFISRGWIVDVADVERFCKRARISTDLDGSHANEPALPKHIQCVQAPQSIGAIFKSEDMSNVRALYYYTGVYYNSCFERGVWGAEADAGRTSRAKSRLPIGAMFNNLADATSYFKSGEFVMTGMYLRAAFRRAEVLVGCDHQLVLPAVFEACLLLANAGMDDARVTLVKHLSNLASVIWSEGDPRRSLLMLLASPSIDSWDPMIKPFATFCFDTWTARSGYESWRAKYEFSRDAGGPLFRFTPTDPSTSFQSILATAAQLGEGSVATDQLRFEYLQHAVYELWMSQKIYETEALLEWNLEALLHARERGAKVASLQRIFPQAHCLALIQMFMQNYASARENLLQTLELYDELVGDGEVFCDEQSVKLDILHNLCTVSNELGALEDVERFELAKQAIYQQMKIKDEQERATLSMDSFQE